MADYPYGPGSYATDQLQAQIIAAGGALATCISVNGSGYVGLNGFAAYIDVLFPTALSAADKTTLDSIVAAHIPQGPRKPRTLLAIYNDLVLLTSTQKTNVWNDLGAGSPAKYLTDAGPAAGSIMVLDWAVRFSGAQASSITDAKMRVTAIYCQDNPRYLVNPSFDTSINIAGDQPA